jgi:hypothetical protein
MTFGLVLGALLWVVALVAVTTLFLLLAQNPGLNIMTELWGAIVIEYVDGISFRLSVDKLPQHGERIAENIRRLTKLPQPKVPQGAQMSGPIEPPRIELE